MSFLLYDYGEPDLDVGQCLSRLSVLLGRFDLQPGNQRNFRFAHSALFIVVAVSD